MTNNFLIKKSVAAPLPSGPRWGQSLLLLLTITLLLCAAPLTGWAASASQIQAAIDKIETNKTLDDATRQNALGYYHQAFQRIQNTEQFQREAAEFKRAVRTGPSELKRLRAQLRRSTSDSVLPAYASIAPMEKRLAEIQADLTALNAERTTLERQASDLTSALPYIQQFLKEAQTTQQEAANQLRDLKSGKTGGDANLVVIEAKKIAAQVEINARTVEITKLKAEQSSLDIRSQLVATRLDVKRQQASQLGNQIAALNEKLASLRQKEAELHQKEAEDLAEQAEAADPTVKTAANENAELAGKLSYLVGRLEQIGKRKEEIRRQLDQVNELRRSAQAQLDIAGYSRALGQVLHKQRRQLPEMQQYEADAGARSNEIAQGRLGQFQAQEQRRSLENPSAAARQLIEQSDTPPPQGTRTQVEDSLYQLLTDRVGLIDRLSSTYVNYVNELTELDNLQRQLVAQSEEYSRLLEENLLWIANAPIINFQWPGAILEGVAWFFQPRLWFTFMGQLWQGLVSYPLLALLIVGIEYLLYNRRSQLTRRLIEDAKPLDNPDHDRITYTFDAIAVSLLLALPGPLLAGTIGWLAVHAPAAKLATTGIGAAFYNVAQATFLINAFRILCQEGGVLHQHFHWKQKPRLLLQRNLTRFLPVMAISTFVIVMTQTQHQETYQSGLGRLMFFVISIAVSAFLWRALHPEQGTVAAFLAARQQRWVWRLRMVWFPIVFLTPAALGLLALYGYYYTAIQLQGKFFSSAWLLVSAVIILHLILRALSITKRKLAAQLERAQWEAELAAHVANLDEVPVVKTKNTELLDMDVDLETLDDKARTMLRTLFALTLAGGLWLIWADITPALRIFDQVTLWQYTTGAGETLSTQSVTVANVGLALLAMVLTSLAARNLPSVLEVVILQRLAMDQGSRYAMSTIARYLITIIGTIIAANLLGLEWSKAQWLVAALSVGLGFGLQEIVANFISGLIILFERPFRVGDTVTVGNVSGTVSRIQIRATTITDWDRKELIVPNKTFITDQLVNWTLSDTTVRVVIKIGIAYGSDTVVAQKVMMDAAKSHPYVLDDPAPVVVFQQFGDSSLDFEIRVFVRALEHLLPVRHDLHMQLNQAFVDHNIEIPYPQRDVHLRSISPHAKLTIDRADEGDADGPGE